MRQLLIVATTLASTIFASAGASATTPAATFTWDMRGHYTINFQCEGCVPHYVNIGNEDLRTGSFSGTASALTMPDVVMKVNGQVSGDRLTEQIDYNNGSNYRVTMQGTIAPNGALSGTATDGSHAITWTTTHKADRVVITPKGSVISVRPTAPPRPSLQH